MRSGARYGKASRKSALAFHFEFGVKVFSTPCHPELSFA